MKARSEQVADFQWFVLRVLTGREKQVERWIGRDGFATFAPTRKRYRFANGQARQRRDKTPVRQPIFPGYVFIGLSAETPSWAPLWRFPPVLNVIGEMGRPTPVVPLKLAELMDKHARGKFNAPDHHRHMATNREFAPGDTVITEDGLIEARVREVRGARSRLIVELFGGEREIDAETARLVRAA